MKLVASEGHARLKVWGELGAADRVEFADQEDRREAEEEIHIRVLSHSPQELRQWLSDVAERQESEVFDRGRNVGRQEAYDHALKVGLAVFIVLLVLNRLFG